MKIDLGTTKNRVGVEEPAVMDVEELLATRLLVQGNSGSGKSHLLRRMLEQSAPHVQQVIIDPEGDFTSLADIYGHVVIDANRSQKELEVLASRVRESRLSAVLNLESLDVDLQMMAAAYFLNALFEAPREIWYPCLVIVDEAQLFAPAAAGEVSDEARRHSLGAMTNLMCRGRKRGLAGVIATQRLAKLAKNVAAEASNFLMGRTFLDIDMARAVDLLGMDRKEAEKFRELGRGQFIALGPALSRRPMPIQVGSVQTQARGSTPKLSARPETSLEAAHDIVFAPMDAAKPVERRPVPMTARTEETDSLLAVVSSKAKEAVDSESTPPPQGRPDADATRDIFFRTAADIMADRDAHFSPEASLYQEFQTRIRIKRLGIPIPQLAEFRKYLTVARAGVPVDDLRQDVWTKALTIASQAPEELRSVYLMFVRSALEGAPCPSDASIARVCGTASSGRAARRLISLEEAGYVVTRADMRAHRIVTLPDLNIETLAGDPKGPDTFEMPMSSETAA